MTLNEYQMAAMTTCMPSCDNFAYMLLNLVGEVGEFASKVAKHIRKGDAALGCGGFNRLAINSRKGEPSDPLVQLKSEAGDIAWQLAGLCKVMGWSLEDVCQSNLEKLADRAKRNVIDGNGDNR